MTDDRIADLLNNLRFAVLDIERVQRELSDLADQAQLGALGSADGNIEGVKDEFQKHVLLAYARGLREAATRFNGPRDFLARAAPRACGPPKLVIDNENKTPAADTAGEDDKKTH